MNERITKIALQAGLEMCSCGCDMPTRQSAKFAELIVRECLKITEGLDQTTAEIKEHFGVEE